MKLIRLISKSMVLTKFLVFYCYELVAAAILIAWDVVTPTRYNKPGTVRMPLDASSDFEIALIANLITFSPGSMVVGLSDDRKAMYVHFMFLKSQQLEIDRMKEKLEARVLEVLR